MKHGVENEGKEEGEKKEESEWIPGSLVDLCVGRLPWIGKQALTAHS